MFSSLLHLEDSVLLAYFLKSFHPISDRISFVPPVPLSYGVFGP